MKVEFVRFNATDDVELQGWFSELEGETAALHIHGMGGNGYENYFLDHLRELYTRHGISFFAIDTRGRGIDSTFRQNDGVKHGGSCYEIFEESEHDIKGAFDYLRSRRKTKFILQGHSLGCTKAVNYLINNDDKRIDRVILLAPTDMVSWASNDPRHKENIVKAKQLIAEGKPEELVDPQCWSLDKTPLSGQSYLSKSEVGSAVDIYGERDDGALLGKVNQPMLIVYGDQDIGIKEIDGSMDKWIERVGKIKNTNTEISVIQGSEHGFAGYEEKLTKIVEGFVKQ